MFSSSIVTIVQSELEHPLTFTARIKMTYLWIFHLTLLWYLSFYIFQSINAYQLHHNIEDSWILDNIALRNLHLYYLLQEEKNLKDIDIQLSSIH